MDFAIKFRRDFVINLMRRSRDIKFNADAVRTASVARVGVGKGRLATLSAAPLLVMYGTQPKYA